MADLHNLTCQTCGSDEGLDGSDGFFYCLRCGSQFEDVVDTAVDDDDLFNKGGETGGGAVYKASHQRRRQHQRPDAIKAEPISQYDSFYDSQSNFIRNLRLEDETPQWSDHGQVKREEFDNPPTVPADFGGSEVPSSEDYHKEIRMRYVMGLQIMIELQCEALVKEFKVTPLICGLVGPIWLRFVSMTGVFDDDWPNKAIFESEMQNEERKYYEVRAKYGAEPRNDFGQRAAMIWFRSLKKMIPLAYTVAVSFLACHLAREAVLPSDMMKWTREGKLPYFSAFVEIERRMGHPSSACPISSSVMFRPQRAVPVQKLESFAAYIAQFIGLELPPVNFNAIAYRYLQKLSLPVGKIISYACRIYEWSMPPELWLSLSKNYFRLPTHVCVMSILVVAIRILYNINGFGEWEKSLSLNGGTKDNGDIGTAFASHDGHDFDKESAEDPAGPQKHELDSAGLLQHLQSRYNEIADTYEYSKDLTTYLKYCRDVVFAGSEPSYGNHEEENMIQYLWNFYQNEENVNPSDLEQSNTFNQRRSRGEGCVSTTSTEEKMRKECFNEPSSDDGTCLADNSAASVDNDDSAASLPDGEDSDSDEHGSGKTLVKEAIRRMKLDMEENRFCYIPPRVKLNKLDYLHYVRKRDEGALTYVAHADYYILLRACARVAQVDIRILHIGVLSLERRLAWLENRIDKCLHSKPTSISCQFCSDMDTGNVSDHISGQTNLNI
ncbi:TATA box-binding protein-associated factor RNA polymerase I subunit B isoform X2 [Gastrolobium bilobum]|uniref:TATA box-binding protein-associated factor RNA polymerase I subunit B isoform X2 n=1 Tax=Gastrolobium bilobum TaxID=150636 RepID=UPI002AB1E877|nr:TATA box-binding protein-associated factor RNA polymerase I subunit B isoform X2 [Gastrolobium bilobum]